MSPEQVAAAADAWVWVHEAATPVETEEYLLVRSPDWFEHPASLVRFEPVREPAVVLDEVQRTARDLGPDRVVVWVRASTPPALEELVRERGGVADEELDVLALDLRPGPPEIAPPDGELVLRWTTELDVVRDAEEVSVGVFGGSVPPDDELARSAERDRLSVARGDGGIVVAYRDGRPVGFGGISVVDGVARLWGGGVLEQERGRGVYRAVLAERLRYGVEQGATMALVKGRVETSGPILRRAGFATFGQERSFVLSL
ncbi:GNAT family N-acetyltransferase [Nocardioides lijunqiniae]|uniref:GNAT family N-acetyltransferase n=1 Tax=Nocardioides lijunqiniae TaxID=2760832 RepID=UPI00187860B7